MRHFRYLATLASQLEVQTYFEIGTSFGESLAVIDCTAICVDPAFRLDRDVLGKKPALFAFQLTSDDFFARHRIASLLPAPHTLDLAFLDGMHHFEFLLRDFMNTEKSCTRDSVVTLHDCLPLHPRAARRVDKRGMPAMQTTRPVRAAGSGWTGDVWKVLRILQKYRPDLRLTVFDCPPSSLVAVTHCDPANRVLEQNYDAIVAEWMEADRRPGWFDALHDSVTLVPSRQHLAAPAMRRVLGIARRPGDGAA